MFLSNKFNNFLKASVNQPCTGNEIVENIGTALKEFDSSIVHAQKIDDENFYVLFNDLSMSLLRHVDLGPLSAIEIAATDDDITEHHFKLASHLVKALLEHVAKEK